MTADASPRSGGEDLRDEKAERPVESHERVWTGRVFGLDEDRVRVTAGGGPVVRQYLAHPGAVGILALRGAAGREQVLLERQYRHPVGAELWEIPAGLLDVAGEAPVEAARRELREEADLEAGRWDVLIDYFTSPGASQESVRVFLARDLRPVPDPFPREDEEADLELVWTDLDGAVDAALSGRLHNPSAVAGVLAVSAARARGWRTLRPLDAPWLR